uniref:Secreted frizzled related protein 5 n=1 Tax=Myotis lucifugus TaxID=59463 RepID=G1Q6H4_MYOLU
MRRRVARGPWRCRCLLGALRWLPARVQEYYYYVCLPKCSDISVDLSLCLPWGYKLMRCSNLLEHESLARGWLPLLANCCLSDTQGLLLLCSSRPPRCGLPHPITPNTSLASASPSLCTPFTPCPTHPRANLTSQAPRPTHQALSWESRLGGGPVTEPPLTKICAQCEMEHNADGLMEQMCSSDFVVKMRIKEIKIENGDRKLIGAQKKKKLLKPGPLKRKDTKRLVLHMKNGAGCPCPQLDSLAGSFLVMGRKVDGQLLLMAVYRWDKKNKEMKFAVKFMFSYPCS